MIIYAHSFRDDSLDFQFAVTQLFMADYLEYDGHMEIIAKYIMQNEKYVHAKLFIADTIYIILDG